MLGRVNVLSATAHAIGVSTFAYVRFMDTDKTMPVGGSELHAAIVIVLGKVGELGKGKGWG